MGDDTKKDATDVELLSVMATLYRIQVDVGAVDESGKAAANSKNINSKQSKNKFMNLKSQIVQRLQTVSGLLKEVSNINGAPKDLISTQSTIRENIRQLGDEWAELNAMYKKEVKKKRSKLTQEELKMQATMVTKLHDEIEKIKEIQRSGFTKHNNNNAAEAKHAAAALYNTSPATPSRGGGQGTEVFTTNNTANITDAQRQQVLDLEARDAEFDKQIDEIGVGIEELGRVADMQNEEVRRQNQMLESTKQKLDTVSERVTTVNTRLKETLNKVGRAGDKMCMDIMCIVMAIGFTAVIYKLAT